MSNEKMREGILSIDYLKSILRLGADGRFYWRSRVINDFPCVRTARSWNSKYANKLAGSVRKPRRGVASYWVIALQIGDRFHHIYAHRLVIAFNSGTWPDGYIDHIDGNGLNNSVENLRVVCSSVSSMNKPLQKNNRTGVPGVSLNKRGAYRVQAGLGGQVFHLGYFSDLFSAACAKKSFEARNAYHDNHGRKSALVNFGMDNS